MSFIRRFGHKSGISLARDYVPATLRMGLVNLVKKNYVRQGFPMSPEMYAEICYALRKRPNEYIGDYAGGIEEFILNCTWDEFYEICETINRLFTLELSPPTPSGPGLQPPRLVPGLAERDYVEDLNKLLEEEGAPWRMAERQIVPAFPDEINDILDEAAGSAAQLHKPGAVTHLNKARQHLSASSPDLQNAVKEAVSAVEAAVKEKAQIDDLGDGLKLLKQQKRLTPHWSSAIQTLFSYASQENQIRHGSPDLSDLTYEDARDLVGLAAILTQHIAGLSPPVAQTR